MARDSHNDLEKLAESNPALYRALIEQKAAEYSLYAFTELMWPFVEPSNKFIGNWHLEAICEMLEAVTNGDITRLLINVPPGMMKSLLTDVFWPAWEWIRQPHYRYICTSYSSALTERDNGRFGMVVKSDLYQSIWGDRFKMIRDSMTKMENNKTGWKIATSTEGMGTGERGDRVVVDDPHNVKDGESDAVRKSTLRYFSEVLPTRLTNPISSAMVVIMQRVHEEDVSGHILTNDLGYTHLMLPMEYEPERACVVFLPNQDPETDEPFFVDPREEDGELIFPERVPDYVVARDKKAMGPYAVSGQFQQAPAPRGGGIIKRDYWKLWPPEGEKFNPDGSPLEVLKYPPMRLIIASVDTAYTEKQENDYSALSILGVWSRPMDASHLKNMIRAERFDDPLDLARPSKFLGPIEYDNPGIMLMHCWKKRLAFRGDVLPRLPDEDEMDYKIRRRKGWGLLEWAAHECARFDVDFLLIENKASGITLAQEMRRVYQNEKWVVELVEPKGDKVARVYSIQHLFAEGMVYAPQRAWAEDVISSFEVFPKGAHDDDVDAVTQGVRWLRDRGWALRKDDMKAEKEARLDYRSKPGPLYDV